MPVGTRIGRRNLERIGEDFLVSQPKQTPSPHCHQRQVEKNLGDAVIFVIMVPPEAVGHLVSR